MHNLVQCILVVSTKWVLRQRCLCYMHCIHISDAYMYIATNSFFLSSLFCKFALKYLFKSTLKCILKSLKHRMRFFLSFWNQEAYSKIIAGSSSISKLHKLREFKCLNVSFKLTKNNTVYMKIKIIKVFVILISRLIQRTWDFSNVKSQDRFDSLT